ncbi:MAG TPA: DUF6036 family nucleotidyltransferase [Dehalococcoidia bacterium]|nr:DUF6036 family nucleotidyltransferase [Dehalococcoidia bacterium]
MNIDEIERCLRQVGRYLHEQGLTGEILLVGGAYMTLVLQQREATKDVDAYFAAHPEAIREAAARVARENGLPTGWLNDAVKGFLYGQPEMTLWLECPGLRVYAPHPSYIFAMKAMAGRPEDLRDLRGLGDSLGLTSASEALAIITRYVPERLLTPRVQYLIEDLFDEAGS